MKRLLLTAAILTLTACGPTPSRINPGADWAIIVAPRTDLVAEFLRRGGDGYMPNATRQDGFTDRERKEIWIVGTRADAGVLQRFAHELLEHGPDNPAARITCPTWDILYGDAAPETEATAKALAEYRRASK